MNRSSHQGLVEAFLGSLLLSGCWFAYHSQELLEIIDYFLIGLVISCMALAISNSLRKSWGRRVLKTDSYWRKMGLWASLFNLTLCTAVLVASMYLALATIQHDRFSYWFWMSLRFCCVPLVFLVHVFSRPKRFRFFLHFPLVFLTVAMSYEIYRIYQQPSLEKREAVTIRPLTQEPFIILNGGVSRLNNVRMGIEQFRHLYSLINTSEAFSPDGRATVEGRLNLSFGKTVYAPVSGTVVEVQVALPDNPIGKPDPNYPMGNYLIIKMESDRYLVVSSLKQNSIELAKGDSVVAGQRIGEVGYSALLSECFLAVCVMDSPDIFSPLTRTLPIYFEGVQLKDRPRVSEPIFPRRNDQFLPDLIQDDL